MRGSSDRRVNLPLLMERELNIHRKNAASLIAHGSVFIDGHCVQANWSHRMTERQLYGRVLKCNGREHRMFGSRIVPVDEQLKF